MTRGDLITYLAHPEWGPGFVEHVNQAGLLVVSFELDGRDYTDTFSPHELELHANAKATA